MGQQAERKKKEDVDGGKKKKEEVLPVVIFKVDVHCDDCASKIKRCVNGFQGVKGVTVDKATNQLRVTGKVDPWMLRDHVDAKTHKKLEIISPVKPPKKEIDGGDSKDQKKNKSKELVASTVVLQIRLCCHDCNQRIKNIILKVKGVQDVSVDDQKDLVTVKGTMNVNSLATYLKDELKRSVQIVLAKNGGGDKKEKAKNGGGDKKEKARDEKHNKKKGGEKEEFAKVVAAEAMVTSMAGVILQIIEAFM